MIDRLQSGRRAWPLAMAAVLCPLSVWGQQLPLQPPQTNFQDATSRPENVAATLEAMQGRVSVLKGSTPWALNVGDSIEPRQMVMTGSDGYAVFRVSDGSSFEVFPNSQVIFRNTYNAVELLDMVVGRIKVFIQKWGGQPNPEKIHTPTAVISVRGTTFDVEVDSNDDSTLIAVEEGQVGVRHRLLYNEQPRYLGGGDQLRVYKNVPIAKAKIDKGSIMQRGANAMAEVFYSIMLRGPRLGGGGGGSSPAPVPGGGGGAPAPLPGDTGAGAPPPPPPPDGSGGGAPAPQTPLPPPPPPL